MGNISKKDLDGIMDDILIIKKRKEKVTIFINSILMIIMPVMIYSLSSMALGTEDLFPRIAFAFFGGLGANVFLHSNTSIFEEQYFLFFYKMRLKKSFPLLINLFKYDFVNETDLQRMSVKMDNLKNNGGNISEIISIINRCGLELGNKEDVVQRIMRSILICKLSSVKDLTVDKYINFLSVENKELYYLVNQNAYRYCELMQILFSKIEVEDFNKNIEKIIDFSTIAFKELVNKKYIMGKIKEQSEKVNDVTLLRNNLIKKSTLSPIKICSKSKVKSI